MRTLLTDFFARSPAMAGPIVAILVFVTVFAVVIGYLMLGRRERFDALAAIALDGDSKARGRHD